MGTDNRLSRSFNWLNVTQFFGALNDNLFQQFMIFSLISSLGHEKEGFILAATLTVFVLPFLLFAAPAGLLSDRISKRNIVVYAKFAEIITMSLGVLVFISGNYYILYFILFAMCTQSAFFGPAKYGIIPELNDPTRLSKANSYLQAFSYLAIIIGTALASVFTEKSGHDFVSAGLLCVFIAITGWVSSTRIEYTPPAGPGRKLSWEFFHILRADRNLLATVLGMAYFLFVGALMKLCLIPFGREVLHLSPERSTLTFIAAAVGIAVGAIFAGRLSGRNVEFGLVPLGAVGMTLTSFFISILPTGQVVWFCITLFGLGLSSGLFVIPLQAFIQFQSPRKHLGQILAASAFLDWVAILLAAGLFGLFSNMLGFSARICFGFVALTTILLMLASLKMLPDFLFRFIVLLLTRCCYRIRTKGLEHIPMKGPALLVCNHITFFDALLLNATQQRRIRFLMSRRQYERNRWFRWVGDLARVIPVQGGESRSRIQASIQSARQALDEGFLVCIFAEGHVSRSGMMLPFRTGMERIIRGTEYPLIPIYIGGGWGSIASYAHGRLFTNWPLKFPYPVSVIFGTPMHASSTAFEVRQRILELSTEYFEMKKKKRKSLGYEFVKSARKNRSKQALFDTSGKQLTFGEALTAVLALSAHFKKRIPKNEHYIGIFLPPSVGAALANISLTLLRKITVNLNYTVSPQSMQGILNQCEMRTVISSRRFLKKINDFPLPENVLYLEDILKKITPADKAIAWLKSRFFPTPFLTSHKKFTADEIVTIIFSSGSTGEPKGVMLSHHNIFSNLESIQMSFKVEENDNIAAVLPLFHSFGFTFTLWLPMIVGFATSYHTHPLESGKIARMIRENHCTLLVSTPTFFAAYMRKVKVEDFTSLRLVLSGAEKLKPVVAKAFLEKYNVPVLEGYGATELSPLATVSQLDVKIDGVYQAGSKENSVGQAAPGVALKVVDPDTLKTLPVNTPGLLMVKGPNVMRGYLGAPEKTAEVLQDGWYNTGDLASIDREGFIFITDRLSRFSKIGGEMIPHQVLEDTYHASLNSEEQVVAVASITDEKKGEQIIVLYTPAAGTAESLQQLMDESDLPNLWKPALQSYFCIEKMPLLGTGKLDLKQLKILAEKHRKDST